MSLKYQCISAFNGNGNFIFPWDDENRNCPKNPISYAPTLHQIEEDPQQMVNGINRLIDDVEKGKQVIYDFVQKRGTLVSFSYDEIQVHHLEL